jgi:hypothetical protein
MVYPRDTPCSLTQVQVNGGLLPDHLYHIPEDSTLHAGFEVTTAVVMKSTIFCLPTAFTLVFCLAYSTLTIEEICSSEMSVDFQQTTWRHIMNTLTQKTIINLKRQLEFCRYSCMLVYKNYGKHNYNFEHYPTSSFSPQTFSKTFFLSSSQDKVQRVHT